MPEGTIMITGDKMAIVSRGFHLCNMTGQQKMLRLILHIPK